MKNKEKLSTVIINGEIIDLSKVSIEKLKEIKAELEKNEKKLREEIDKLLSM